MNFRVLLASIISCVLIGALLWRIDVGELSSLWRTLYFRWAMFGVISLLAAQIFASIRWHLILVALRHGIGLRRALTIYFANLPISRIAPVFSGDFMKAAYLRSEYDVMRNVGGIFVEPYFDMLAISILVLLGGMHAGMQQGYFGLGLLSVVLLLGVVILSGRYGFIPDRWRLPASRFAGAFRDVVSNWRLFLLISFVTAMSWVAMMCCVRFFLLSFGADVDLSVVLTIQPFVILISLIPISIGGVGSREASMVAMYSSYALPASIFSAGLLFSLLNTVILPIICIPLTIRHLRDSMRAHK